MKVSDYARLFTKELKIAFFEMFEDWVDIASFDSNVEHLGLLCVHAHVRLRGKVSIQNLRKRYQFPRTLLLSIPCCGKFRFQADMGTKPDREYEDPCIFSKHRKVSAFMRFIICVAS